MNRPNYFWHAFKQPMNILLLIGGVAVSFFVDIPYDTLVAIGANLLLVAGMSANGRFQRTVRAKLHRQEEAYQLQHQKNKIRTSGQANRDRLRGVEQMARLIKTNYRSKWKESYTSKLLNESFTGIDKLERSFAGFFFNQIKLAAIETNTQKEDTIRENIEKIKSEIANAGSSQIKELLEKRVEILEKHLNNSNVFHENSKILETQIDMIEDTLKYLLDESVNIYDPKLITNQVDQVLGNMEITKDTLREIDSFIELSDVDLSSTRVR